MDLDEEELKMTRDMIAINRIISPDEKTADQMFEEKIIKSIESMIKAGGTLDAGFERGEEQILQGLLELYNKIKSENKNYKYAIIPKLEGELKGLKDGIKFNLVEELEEVKAENQFLSHQINSAFSKGFIHKDKIRTKIKEVKQLENVSIADILESEKDFCIAVLEELLEE